jgi:predicted phage terminase large subunit-like protein
MDIVFDAIANGLRPETAPGASPAAMAMAAGAGLWLPARHLELISSRLTEMETRPLRLIVLTPPRHGKSNLISCYTPAWFLGRHPDRNVLLASYEAEFAATWGRKARDVLEQHGQRFFGIRIRSDSSAASRWQLEDHGGGMATAGVGGPLTGRGANLMIIDDPVKNSEDANSDVIREKQWDWFRSTAYTRLEPGGSIVLVMTRWHDDDLAGRILADPEIGPGWEVIRLPAIVEDDDLPDPLERAVGEALWPERYPVEELAAIRRVLGSYLFSALYQGRPAPAEGNLFKRDDLRYWRPIVSNDSNTLYNLGGGRIINPVECTRLTMVDLATTIKTTSDYTVVGTFDIDPNGLMVCVDLDRRRLDGPDLLPLLKAKYQQWQPALMGVESAGFQIAIIQQARRDGLPVIELKAEKDKLSRALTASAKHESEQIWFEADAAYLDALVPELLSFPRGTYDDQVDVIAFAAIEAQKRMSDWMSVYAPTPEQRENLDTGEWGRVYALRGR